MLETILSYDEFSNFILITFLKDSSWRHTVYNITRSHQQPSLCKFTFKHSSSWLSHICGGELHRSPPQPRFFLFFFPSEFPTFQSHWIIQFYYQWRESLNKIMYRQSLCNDCLIQQDYSVMKMLKKSIILQPIFKFDCHSIPVMWSRSLNEDYLYLFTSLMTLLCMTLYYIPFLLTLVGLILELGNSQFIISFYSVFRKKNIE